MKQTTFGQEADISFLRNIDLILTMGPPYCCMADAIDIKTGIQSGMQTCKNHPIYFVDNEFKDYDHEVHLAAVKELGPKYATIRDAISPEMCRANAIQFYDLETLLQMYEEVKQYAENVIVIPKYKEAIDFFASKCDSHIMFGYPNNTYGRTTTEKDITIDAYKEYNVGVHILGGSPKSQREVAIKFDGQVKSLDNNYIFKVSPKGISITENGSINASDLGLPKNMDSIMIPSMAISICSFRRIFDQKWK